VRVTNEACGADGAAARGNLWLSVLVIADISFYSTGQTESGGGRRACMQRATHLARSITLATPACGATWPPPPEATLNCRCICKRQLLCQHVGRVHRQTVPAQSARMGRAATLRSPQRKGDFAHRSGKLFAAAPDALLQR